MPLDTSIPLQVQMPQFAEPVDPMVRQMNALRMQTLQQEMARNAMLMQNTMEDRRREEANRRLAAATAAAEQRRKQELMGIYGQFGTTPAAVGQRGVGYSGTGMSTDPYAPIRNQLVQRGFLSQAADVAELENKMLTGTKTKAELPGIQAESRKKGTEADVAEYDAAVGRLVPLVRMVKSGPDAANFTNTMYDDPLLGPRLERVIPRAQAVARAAADYEANPTAWMQRHMLTGKELSDALSTVPAGKTETITGADGNMLLLDKTTGVARPITMAPAAGTTAGAPAAAGTPVRAAPTTEAQIKLAQSKEALPGAIETAELTLKQLEDMVGSARLGTKGDVPEHPGFGQAVGAGFPFARLVPGTDAADFSARFDQIQGGAFLKAYETLKGTGQITEKEGEKATAAINRMNLSQSEKEFARAAREFYDVVGSALTRAKTKMGGGAPANAADNKSIFDAADAILGGK